MLVTRAQYAGGLSVCVRLYICVRTYVYVCRQKTRLFASHRSKIATKILSAAFSLNLYSYEDVFSTWQILLER